MSLTTLIVPACAALAIDPLEQGLQLLDAATFVVTDPRTPSEAALVAPSWSEAQGVGRYPLPLPFPLVATRPALICRLADHNLAGYVRRALAQRFPASHMLTLVRAGDQTSWQVALAALEDQPFTEDTCVYLPPLTTLTDLRGADGPEYTVMRLLGPGGCPWDREQTPQSLRKDLLEETHEVLEALDSGSTEDLTEELGDLLLQILMHAEMARQAGTFTLGDIYEQISAKLIRRHPHVFGDTVVAGTAEVLRNWEAIKQAERAGKGKQVRGPLDGIPAGLPALPTALELSRKAAKLGFDWPSVAGAWNQLDQEIRELREATPHTPHAAEELGDVLFALVDLARWLAIEPESALRAANAKFRRRFGYVVQRAADRDLHDLPLEQLLAFWDEAKANGA